MVPSILLCPFIQSIFKRAQVSFWPWWRTTGAGMGKLLLRTGERRNIPFLFILEVAVDLGHWGPSYYGAPLNICLLFVSSIQFRRHFGQRKMSRKKDLIWSIWGCLSVFPHRVWKLKIPSYWETVVVYPVLVFVCFSSC